MDNSEKVAHLLKEAHRISADAVNNDTTNPVFHMIYIFIPLLSKVIEEVCHENREPVTKLYHQLNDMLEELENK